MESLHPMEAPTSHSFSYYPLNEESWETDPILGQVVPHTKN